jgi:hypothetical protein
MHLAMFIPIHHEPISIDRSVGVVRGREEACMGSTEEKMSYGKLDVEFQHNLNPGRLRLSGGVRDIW